jgi:hypothetical protein
MWWRPTLGKALTDDLVTELLPILGRSLERGFNVFDVMHHGTHEKQISNVFGWLLDSGGNHNLHDRFLQIFIDEVNAESSASPLPHETYRVRQEVNTGLGVDQIDIADLVLDGPSATVVIENYFTSDGHGHNYERYLAFARRNGRRGAVVLLCRDENRLRQTQGWENAVVMTYGRLIHVLSAAVGVDARYKRKNPDAYAFIKQLHQKFVSERGLVAEQDVLRFVTALCETGEADRYGESPRDKAAERFASDLAVQARERFDEGREILRRLKGLLRDFAAGPLRDQLNASLGHERVHKVSATYAGIYQWTINLDVLGDDGGAAATMMQLKFGPSAWVANERDPHWKVTVDKSVVDYSKVFVTHSQVGVIRQSTVTLQDLLDGLDPTDTRLHDEVIELLGGEVTPQG